MSMSLGAGPPAKDPGRQLSGTSDYTAAGVFDYSDSFVFEEFSEYLGKSLSFLFAEPFQELEARTANSLHRDSSSPYDEDRSSLSLPPKDLGYFSQSRKHPQHQD